MDSGGSSGAVLDAFGVSFRRPLGDFLKMFVASRRQFRELLLVLHGFTVFLGVLMAALLIPHGFQMSQLWTSRSFPVLWDCLGSQAICRNLQSLGSLGDFQCIWDPLSAQSISSRLGLRGIPEKVISNRLGSPGIPADVKSFRIPCNPKPFSVV